MADEIVKFENSPKKKKRKRAHPWAFPLGLLMAVLSVTGLVTILVAGVNGISSVKYKIDNIEKYNTMLTPVVMNDPSVFDDISKADMSQLIDISVWAIIKSGLAPDTYEYSEAGMIIPEADIAASYTKLFGTERAPVHMTVSGYGYEFTYDSAKKCYIIPLTGIEPTYTPSVVDVDKKKNMIVLTVGYLPSGGWAQDTDGKMVAPEPDKYVKVTLREKDGNYYISAMQATASPEVATTTPVSTTTAPAESTTEPTTAPEQAAEDALQTEIA